MTGHRDSGRAGFTLIELLVVIGIISFVAALVVAFGPGLFKSERSSRGAQSLQGIFSNQLEHSEARRALSCYFYLDHAGIHQGGEREDHLFRSLLLLGPADCFRRLQRPAPHKNPERAKTLLLCLGEQVVAPGNGFFHGLLAGWQVSCPVTQDRQAMGETLIQIR